VAIGWGVVTGARSFVTARKKIMRKSKTWKTMLFAIVAAAGPGLLHAQPTAPDFLASPDVYKVIAQNERSLVVQGVWKPGQRDQFHSHPAQLFYWLTDCRMRWYLPNGSTRDITVVAGHAGSVPPIESHSVENTGAAECRVLMFEAAPAS
jgi:quercetin dioxygenase-like cupin family protein